LQEIAENHGVSRNAVHDQIKKTVKKLEQFEHALSLHEKQEKRKKLIAALEEEPMTEHGKTLIEALKKVE